MSGALICSAVSGHLQPLPSANEEHRSDIVMLIVTLLGAFMMQFEGHCEIFGIAKV